MLRSDLCDFSNAYIVVKGTTTVTNPDNNVYDKKIIDNAEDFDVVMPMYNLLEYSKNYSKTIGSFWNYYRDDPNNGAVGNISYSIKDSKSLL